MMISTSSWRIHHSQRHISHTLHCCRSIRNLSYHLRLKDSYSKSRAIRHATTQELSDSESLAECSDCYTMADDIAAGQSFQQAFHNSAPPIIPDDVAGIKLSGIQQFAAAIWDRQKNIPSQGVKSPLERVFDAFDVNGDGRLSAAEVAAALRSRGVDITEEVARKFVAASDTESDELVEKAHFSTLIILMASADLRVRMTSESDDPSDCEVEWDFDGQVILPSAPHCQSSGKWSVPET